MQPTTTKDYGLLLQRISCVKWTADSTSCLEEYIWRKAGEEEEVVFASTSIARLAVATHQLLRNQFPNSNKQGG